MHSPGFAPLAPRSARWHTALLAVLLPALTAVSASAQETVFSNFDLAGWARLGVISLSVDPATGTETGATAREAHFVRAFDGDRTSSVAARRPGPLPLAVDFEPPQVLRRVRVWPDGPDAFAVSLEIVQANGQRFAAGETVIDDGAAAVFRLLDVECSRVEITVERITGAPGNAETDGPTVTSVADIDISGRLVIEDIALQDVPRTMPEGGGFPVRIVGRDSFGGRPDLTAQAQIAATPARSLALTRGSRAVALANGTIALAPVLGSLRGPELTTAVLPLQTAPPAPTAIPGTRSTWLGLQGEPPFQILRRQVGAKSTQHVGRCDGDHFVDTGLAAGRAYQYSVRRIDRFGNPVSAPSREARVRILADAPPGHADAGRLPTLVVIFTDSLQPGEREAIEESIEAARGFLDRHSRGGLLVDTTYLPLSGPTPITTGPTMAGIEARLRSHGIEDDQYAVVFAVADDLSGSYGGFTLLGRTAGAFGRTGTAPTPDGALGPDPGMAWAFVHELWHVIGLQLAESAGLPLQPTGHFADDFAAGLLGPEMQRPFDAGDLWDGQAALLSRFEAWDRVGAPYRRLIEVIDRDGDGLADDDPRLPLDERRLGSDPTAADADGDGLDDRAEAAAGLYRGTDPNNPDSDGDGLGDGDDPWPLDDFTGVIARGPTLRRLATLPTTARPDAPSLELAAAWTEQGLIVSVTADGPCDVFLSLDGSGDLGPWRGRFDTGVEGAPAGDVWTGDQRLALRAHHEPRGVFVGDRRVPGARVRAELHDGRHVVIAELPAALGPGSPSAWVPPGSPRSSGLQLQVGTVIGLGVVVRPARADDPAPFDPWVNGADGRPAWLSLFEAHRLLDAVLQP